MYLRQNLLNFKNLYFSSLFPRLVSPSQGDLEYADCIPYRGVRLS